MSQEPLPTDPKTQRSSPVDQESHATTPPTNSAPELAGAPDELSPVATGAEATNSNRLEQVQVSWQSSWQFKAVEWLKALAGVAAIGGLFFAFMSNLNQLEQFRIGRDEDRFDKAVSRLGSENSSERLTGLSGLQLFLNSPQKEKQGATLLFLANAVAIEKDTTVRGAILDTFQSLGRYHIDKQVLNDTLIAARDRNRASLKDLQSKFALRLEKDSKAIFEKGHNEVSLGTPSEEELAPLRATATTIASLVRSGAFVQDLSETYCVSCDFSLKDKTVELSKVNFDKSYLRDALFTNANLESASFDGAYLSRTDFTRANLRHAKLTSPPLSDPPIQAILSQKALWGTYGPIFECADLSEADFTGSVLFGFYWGNINGSGYFPRFYGANLSRAKLNQFKVFSAIPAESLPKGPLPPGAIKGDILPIKSASTGSYESLPVEGWGSKQYLITTYDVREDFAFTASIQPELWRSVYAALNSFGSAKNLDDADMPTGLRAFMTTMANKGALKPVISTTCPAPKG